MLSRKEREMRQRRQDIINAAKELFQQKDYEDVTMQEIALKAEFTRRTLYSYFRSKLDLITVIVMESFVDMARIIVLEISKQRTSYDKLFAYGFQQYKFYLENPSSYKLLHYFDIAIHEAEVKLSDEVLAIINSAPTELDDLIYSVFQEGVADGTFREDLNISLAKDYFSKAWYGIIHQYILHPQHPQNFCNLELEYLIGGLLR